MNHFILLIKKLNDAADITESRMDVLDDCTMNYMMDNKKLDSKELGISRVVGKYEKLDWKSGMAAISKKVQKLESKQKSSVELNYRTGSTG